MKKVLLNRHRCCNCILQPCATVAGVHRSDQLVIVTAGFQADSRTLHKTLQARCSPPCDTPFEWYTHLRITTFKLYCLFLHV